MKYEPLAKTLVSENFVVYGSFLYAYLLILYSDTSSQEIM